VLSRFPPAITQRALALKREHPSWGPDRILADLGREPSLLGQPLPSRSRLALLFKTNCPDLVAAHAHARHRQPSQPSPRQSMSAGNSISKKPFRSPMTIVPASVAFVTLSVQPSWPLKPMTSRLGRVAGG
jgi:hypothetical protein